MSEWTAVVGGISKSLAEWGLGSARCRRLSQDADEFEFTAPSLSFDADPIMPNGAAVTIQRDGVTVFAGSVIEVPVFASGLSEGQRYRIANAWSDLTQLVYQQEWYLQVDPEHPEESLVGGLQSRTVLFQGINGAKVTVGQQIADVVAYAASCGVAIQLAPDVEANFPATPPFDESLDLTCAEVIRKALRWAPDSITWFDYATTPPTLHVARRSQMEAVEIPVTGAPVASISLTPRYDLQAPSVVLKYERIHSVDGVSWREVVRDVYPTGGDERVPGTVVATIDLEGSSVTHNTATIVCRPFDPATVDWWKVRENTMRDWYVSEIALNTSWYAQTEDGSEVGPGWEDRLPDWRDWTYELVKGQIAPWMLGAGKVARSITVNTTMDYSYNKDDATVSATARKVHEKPISARVTVTNLPSGTYTTVASAVIAEDVPIGLAQLLFEGVGELHYQGSLVLEGDEPSELVPIGRVLNLTGGRPEWASARALIQSVEEDIDSGRVTVQFGPPTHLGPADLIELLRFNRQRRVSLGYGSRTTGQSAVGAEGGLGEVTANHDSGLGDGGVMSRLGVAEYGGVRPGINPELQDIARSVDINPADLDSVGIGYNTAKFHRLELVGVDGPITAVVLCQRISG